MYTHFRLFGRIHNGFMFVSVFHRILDFKTGLDFYPGPFFILSIQPYKIGGEKLTGNCVAKLNVYSL